MTAENIALFDAARDPLTGRMLIEASAGTGKTFQIAEIVLRLIIDYNLPLSGILVTTFTRAAAAELKGRIRTRLEKAAFDKTMRPDTRQRLQGELLLFDEAVITTIHGFCQRVLYDCAFESGSLFDTELSGDSDRALAELLAHDFWRKHVAPEGLPEHERAAALLKSFESIAQRLLSRPLLIPAGDGGGLKEAFCRYVREELPKRKEKAATRSYTDILRDLDKALSDTVRGTLLTEQLSRRYKAVIIDEFQDTDPLQYRIFSKLFPHADTKLFFIGDPKQLIYGFRSADIGSYLKARQNCVRKTLGINYRSSPPMVKACNTLFGQSSNVFVIDAIEFHPVESAKLKLWGNNTGLIIDGRQATPFHLWWLGTEEEPCNKGFFEEQLITLTAAEISQLLAKGREGTAVISVLEETLENAILLKTEPVNPSHIAVLVHTGNEAKAVQKALLACGVPCSALSAAASVFESLQATEFLLLLTAALYPNDEKSVRGALCTALFAKPLEALAALSEPEGEQEREAWLELFHDLSKSLRRGGPAHLWAALTAKVPVKKHLMSLENGARQLCNFEHIAELLQSLWHEEKLSPEELPERLKILISSNILKESYYLRPHTDEAAVRIMTMHGSKGLQFPIVFAPFMQMQPKDSDSGTYTRDGVEFISFSDEGRAAGSKEQEAELIRLAYVAFTRAKYRCYSAWGAVIDGRKKTPLTGSPGWRLFSNAKAVLTDQTLFTVLPVAEPPEPVLLIPQHEQTRLTPAIFNRRINAGLVIESASGLMQGSSAEDSPDRDAVTAVEAADLRYAALPKGRRTGTLVHEVFEKIDFTNPDWHTTGRLLKQHLPALADEQPVRDALKNMVENALAAELPGGFSLNRIDMAQRLNELEFYYTISKESLPKFEQFIADYRRRRGEGAPLRFGSSQPGEQGFMHGFIDMICRHKGRYYLFDWKTTSSPDYSPAALERLMAAERYDVQYLLYSAALLKLLNRRLGACNYDAVFGGVCYLFVRGVAPGSTNGIFWVKPHKTEIEQLMELLE